jgi:hypothetical protein
MIAAPGCRPASVTSAMPRKRRPAVKMPSVAIQRNTIVHSNEDDSIRPVAAECRARDTVAVEGFGG